jgi:crotonobetainyl-CoA:carnitine CoA-transferase CaiB-like acyl-CoA transferase
MADAQGRPTGEAAYYLCANRRKKSIAVDIQALLDAAVIRERPA